jgi:molybdate/tungstate transport system substrate-binding protein
VSYTNKKGQVYTGSPILYTATVPSTATNTQGAQAFVQYLLTKDGQALLAKEGLLSTPPSVGGDATTLPPVLKPFVKT